MARQYLNSAIEATQPSDNIDSEAISSEFREQQRGALSTIQARNDENNSRTNSSRTQSSVSRGTGGGRGGGDGDITTGVARAKPPVGVQKANALPFKVFEEDAERSGLGIAENSSWRELGGDAAVKKENSGQLHFNAVNGQAFAAFACLKSYCPVLW